MLALQFRGPSAAPTPVRAWAWLIEVRDWHRCFCLLSQARYEQRRNKDRASTAHAKQRHVLNPPTSCQHFAKAPWTPLRAENDNIHGAMRVSKSQGLCQLPPDDDAEQKRLRVVRQGLVEGTVLGP